ncbi:MAG TPA: NAD-dependent epimerase/dehydratase family protein [Wenzhouxiangellaceae bacterium]|nr:NAD-dependent epimerase/dehydratase family protein [Wenzhouxiangellaceae bacterium]
MQVIAVTGATGFVGKATVLALRRALPDTQFRLLIRNATSRRLPDEFAGCTIIDGTLGSPDALNALVRGADCVVHIAAAIRGNSALDFERDNICGTRRIVDALAANASEAHLIHVSSLAARRPELSWYAASKRAAEEVVAGNCNRFSILRPPAVYGPEDPALAGFWRTLARGWLIRAGSGDSRFSMLHVDDLAEAICRLAEYGPTSASLSLAGPQPDHGWRWEDLADLAQRAGERKIRIVSIPGHLLSAGGAFGLVMSRIAGRRALLSPGKARELLHHDWVCDNLGIEERLNWKPTTRLGRALDTLPGWNNR